MSVSVTLLVDQTAIAARGNSITFTNLTSDTSGALVERGARIVHALARAVLQSIATNVTAAATIEPTPVQRECWAWLLRRSPPDLVAISPTGSGKTLAFLLPVFAELLSDSFDSAASCDLATQATALSVPDTAVSAVPVAAAKTATSAVATSASSFDAAVKAEAMAAMRVTATAVFAREIGAGRTPEEAHAIASEEGKSVWRERLRIAKLRLTSVAASEDCNTIAASPASTSAGAGAGAATNSVTAVRPSALVLVPTRELCAQIADAAQRVTRALIAEDVTASTRLSLACVYGGVDFHRQRAAVLSAAPALVVATPGRLLGLCGIVPASTRARMAGQQKGPRGAPPPPHELPSEQLPPVLALNAVRVLVLDEADRLLALGFEDDVNAVFALLPGGCNRASRPWTLLFSATWDEATARLAQGLVRTDALHLTVGSTALAAAATVEQRVEVLRGKHQRGAPRLKRLLQLLIEHLGDLRGNFGDGDHDDNDDDEDQDISHAAAAIFNADDSEDECVSDAQWQENGASTAADSNSVSESFESDSSRIIVFVLYKQEAKALARLLVTKGILAVALHGDLSQTQRSAAILAFRVGEARVLVATDVAARGLDVLGVRVVINYSLGQSLDMYVHRCGRCGRAGGAGRAYSFLVDGDEPLAPALVALLARTRQPVSEELREVATEASAKLARQARGKIACSGGGSEHNEDNHMDDDDDAAFERRERLANVQRQRDMQQQKMTRERAQQKRRQTKK